MKPVVLSKYLLITSAVLVAVIYLLYPALQWSLKLEAGACLFSFILLIAFALIIEKFKHKLSGKSKQNLLAGLYFGLLWTIEISMNNFIQPKLPLRDYLDNIFWGIIAVLILYVSYKDAFNEKKIIAGIKAGFFSGFASGIIACITALALICFGMKLLLKDAVNIAEWTDMKNQTPYPNMASYFAYQTFAGAILHLVLLGIIMGLLLGIIGGLLGKLLSLKTHSLLVADKN
jgi:hypothetical protein